MTARQSSNAGLPAAGRTAEEYDALAEEYDRYFSDRLARLTDGHGRFSDEVEALLARLSPGAPVLDCACGTGHLALGLSRRGYRAYGSDISSGSIHIARRHARELTAKVRFKVAAWRDLPNRMRRRFDLVICAGNAIGHCRGERDMLAALRGMHAVLRPGGSLYLDTRWWENRRRDKVRFQAYRTKVVGDEHLTWLLVHDYPRRLEAPHLIEVVVLCERGGATTVRSFPVTYYPFRRQDLRRRLRTAGFTNIAISDRDQGWYSVTAAKPSPAARRER